MQNGSRKGNKVQPMVIRKVFFTRNCNKPATIRSNNESEFVIEISKEKESKILPSIKSLCSTQLQKIIEVEIFVCNKINQSKGQIFIHDYNIPDLDDYSS